MLCPASVNRRNRYLLSLKRTFDITHPLLCRERVQNKTKIGKKSCFSCYSVAMGTVPPNFKLRMRKLCARALIMPRELFQTHHIDWPSECEGEVYKIDRQIVLEKCGTADCTPAAVTIEERIGWILLWEMGLDYGERCARKIQWLAKALCHRCFGEDCTYPHVTITEDLLNSMDTNLQSVFFLF